MTYLTESGRKALLEYHYVGCDSSYISQLMNPYWEFVATLMPVCFVVIFINQSYDLNRNGLRNVLPIHVLLTLCSPNTITLIGTIGIVLAYLLQVTYYCGSNLHGVSPSYVYVLCAILLFAYQTLDSVDGKRKFQEENI